MKSYSESLYDPLALPDKTLSGLMQCPLKVQGQFLATLQRGNKISKQNVYVIQELNRALLGLPAVKALQDDSFIETLQACKVFALFPNFLSVSCQSSSHVCHRHPIHSLLSLQI